MSTQCIQCVEVKCIQSITDNCLTLEKLPLGIVGILIPQIHPIKLICPFINQRKLKWTILPHQCPNGTRSQELDQHCITITKYT